MPVLYSEWSDSVEVTPIPLSWWLKMPTDPTRNLPVVMREVSPIVLPSRQQVVEVLGASLPIVNVDAYALSGAARGTALVFTETAAERARVRALIQSGQVLLLQSTNEWDQPGDHIYVRTSAPTETRLAMQPLPYRDTSFDYVQVAAP